jgi:hypothetical protein
MNELTALRHLWEQVRRVSMTPPVDDDFPQVISDMYAAHDEAGEVLNTAFNITDHLERQRAWSLKTFGPGMRTKGVIDHMRKELDEIEQNPHDLEERIDLIGLAFDGALRAGFTPDEIIQQMVDKQLINENRTWPDWKTADPDKAIEHVRSSDGLTDIDKVLVYEDWVRHQKDHGRSLAEFPCPECLHPLFTRLPPPGESFSSLASCPYCNDVFFKVVNPNGDVDLVDERAMRERHGY